MIKYLKLKNQNTVHFGDIFEHIYKKRNTNPLTESSNLLKQDNIIKNISKTQQKKHLI